jgi:hypothetical protein
MLSIWDHDCFMQYMHRLFMLLYTIPIDIFSLVYNCDDGIWSRRQKCCTGVDLQLWVEGIWQGKCLCTGIFSVIVHIWTLLFCTIIWAFFNWLFPSCYTYGVWLFSFQIAISTDDVYKTAEAIRVNGGRITREPGPLPGINTKITACTDPDGWKTVCAFSSCFSVKTTFLLFSFPLWRGWGNFYF